MINSYLGNICPFPPVTRNVKEELRLHSSYAFFIRAYTHVKVEFA
jgi:hypothetical protein